MRRFVTLAILLLFTIPFGVSISGCSKKSPTIFCNGGDNGIPVGQVTTITLSPQIFGISLNFAQIGQVGAPVATDCKGTTESVSSYTYGTFLANGTPDMTIADVQPTTGKLCAGTWNRNTGGGIPDFTIFPNGYTIDPIPLNLNLDLNLNLNLLFITTNLSSACYAHQYFHFYRPQW